MDFFIHILSNLWPHELFRQPFPNNTPNVPVEAPPPSTPPPLPSTSLTDLIQSFPTILLGTLILISILNLALIIIMGPKRFLTFGLTLIWGDEKCYESQESQKTCACKDGSAKENVRDRDVTTGTKSANRHRYLLKDMLTSGLFFTMNLFNSQGEETRILKKVLLQSRTGLCSECLGRQEVFSNVDWGKTTSRISDSPPSSPRSQPVHQVQRSNSVSLSNSGRSERTSADAYLKTNLPRHFATKEELKWESNMNWFNRNVYKKSHLHLDKICQEQRTEIEKYKESERDLNLLIGQYQAWVDVVRERVAKGDLVSVSNIMRLKEGFARKQEAYENEIRLLRDEVRLLYDDIDEYKDWWAEAKEEMQKTGEQREQWEDAVRKAWEMGVEDARCLTRGVVSKGQLQGARPEVDESEVEESEVEESEELSNTPSEVSGSGYMSLADELGGSDVEFDCDS